jgi:hypothetical protein
VLQGAIFGFGANTTQSIDLVGVDFASANKSYSGNKAANFTLKNDGLGGTLITDPRDITGPANPANILLFGSYIASAFAATGHGSALLGEGLPVQAQPLLSLPHG